MYMTNTLIYYARAHVRIRTRRKHVYHKYRWRVEVADEEKNGIREMRLELMKRIAGTREWRIF